MYRLSKNGPRSLGSGPHEAQRGANKENTSNASISHSTLPTSEDGRSSGFARSASKTGSQPSSTENVNHLRPRGGTGKNAHQLRNFRATKSFHEGSRVRGFQGSRPPSQKTNDSCNNSIIQGKTPQAIDHRVLDLDSINDENNDIVRSSQGKTSGVYFLTEPTSAETKAVLKQVNDDEIIANKLFELLGMPVPKFDVWDVNQISSRIKDTFNNEASRRFINRKYEKIMVMQRINGCALSELDPDKIKEFIRDKDNLRSLGRSMACDMIIGNADRVFFFRVPISNPDNIMIEDGHAVFIDQVFSSRSEDMWISSCNDLMKSMKEPDDSASCIYQKFISPLLQRSLTKHTTTPSLNDGVQNRESLLKEFNESITTQTKADINAEVSRGIQEAIDCFIAKKEEALGLLESHPAKQRKLLSIHTHLESLKVKNLKA